MSRARLALVLGALSFTACGEDAADPAPSVATHEAAHEEAVREPAAPEAERPPPPEVERPYDEDADAQAQIDAAVAASRVDGKRVLLMFGANWCVWCRRLDHVFQNHPQVSAQLEQAYHLVHVDVGARESDTNRDVVRRYGDPMSQGLPCLVVLDEAGDVAHVQETGSLEEGDRHDPELVLGFLNRWAVPAGA